LWDWYATKTAGRVLKGTDVVPYTTLAPTEGVVGGVDMLTFFPFHLSATQIKEWILSWLGSDAELLEPKDWFDRGRDLDGDTPRTDGYWWPAVGTEKFIWAPAFSWSCKVH
jgi:hypothetical protein